MSVDVADAAVAIDVVAGKQQVSQAKGELAMRVSGRVPRFQLEVADAEDLPLADGPLNLDAGQVDRDALGRDLRVGPHAVPFGQQALALFVADRLRVGKQFFRTLQAL